MTHSYPAIAQLILRVFFAASLAHAAVTAPLINEDPLSMGHLHQAVPLVVRAVMTMMVIWLILGIRTRVVAALGLAFLLVTSWLCVPAGMMGGSAGQVAGLLALASGLPLVMFGGGTYSLYRGGWRNLA